MTKKIFALVMVVSVLGSIFVAGCKKEEPADGGTTTAATTGTDKGATTGTDAAK